MLAARLKEMAGDVEGAAIELRRAVRSPEHRDQASVWLARMDAESGQCRRATSVLWGKLMTPTGRKAFSKPRAVSACALFGHAKEMATRQPKRHAFGSCPN